jgi:hypothetical protein
MVHVLEGSGSADEKRAALSERIPNEVAGNKRYYLTRAEFNKNFISKAGDITQGTYRGHDVIDVAYDKYNHVFFNYANEQDYRK